MKRHDLDLWQAAETLVDLGELVARWLEGKISSQPGYAEGCGPDPETTPLIGTLAAVNRAGLVTTNSQPGVGGVQRATVHAFVDEAAYRQICDDAKRAGLWLCAGKAPSRTHYVTPDGRTVSRWNPWKTGWGRGAWPDLGVCLSRGDIRDSWIGYGICSRQAQDVLCDAWQTTLIDPEPGRNDRLWPLLDQLAAQRSRR
jgi:hypothetical protein